MVKALPLIDEMQERIASLREALEDFNRDQGGGRGDEANEGHIEQARRALDDLEGAVGDLVP
jgi:hypothetical protein